MTNNLKKINYFVIYITIYGLKTLSLQFRKTSIRSNVFKERKKIMKILNRGEIYYANLSLTVGSEQGGIRPVLILQNDKGNVHSNTTIVAPITSQRIDNTQPTHINVVADGLAKPSTVLVEQIRTIDKMRLREYIRCHKQRFCMC